MLVKIITVAGGHQNGGHPHGMTHGFHYIEIVMVECFFNKHYIGSV